MNTSSPAVPVSREIPLPPKLPRPLPERLRWSQVMACFALWNVGGKPYLDLLVESGVIVPVKRKHCTKGKLYPTAQVLAVHPDA